MSSHGRRLFLWVELGDKGKKTRAQEEEGKQNGTGASPSAFSSPTKSLFLEKEVVPRNKLQLAFIYEEVSVPVVEDLLIISDRAYTKGEVCCHAGEETEGTHICRGLKKPRSC